MSVSRFNFLWAKLTVNVGAKVQEQIILGRCDLIENKNSEALEKQNLKIFLK